MSSIDWICSELTVRPILAISALEPSRTSVASFCRSVTISSTVIEPMIERRWPAKIRPGEGGHLVLVGQAPLARVDDALVVVADLERDDRPDVQRDALPGDTGLGHLGLAHRQGEVAGLAEERKHESAVADHNPERCAGGTPPASAAGYQHGLVGGGDSVTEHGQAPLASIVRKSIIRKGVERVRPLAHVHRSRAAGFDDQHGRAPGDRLGRPGEVGFRASADLEQHLTGPAFPRVATMTTPMEPIRDWSPATVS